MTIDRRDFLAHTLLGLFAAGCASRARGSLRAGPRQGAPAPGRDPIAGTGPRPKRYVQVFLDGGVDALYLTNPQLAKDLDPKVVVPYGPDEILQAGPVRLAPYGIGLKPVAERMVAINGVIGGTVAHEYGAQFIARMGHVPADRPSIARVLANAVAPDAPIHEISFDRGAKETIWKPSTGKTLYIGERGQLLYVLQTLAADPSQARQILDVLRKGASSDPSHAATIERELVAWLEKFPAEPIRKVNFFEGAPDPWKMWEYKAPGLSMDFVESWMRDKVDEVNERFSIVLYILEHDLAPSTFVVSSLDWDSHHENHLNQRVALSMFCQGMAGFLNELGRRRAPTGELLSESTAIVASSELGRFPFINSDHGKDHFPELPIMMFGPGLRPGTYGSTGRTLESQPISFETGQPTKLSSGRVPTMDDVGATLCRWFGAEHPRDRTGDVLSFVLPTAS